MARSVCPNRETLYGLLVGLLDEADADTVVAHLEDCLACRSAAETLDDSTDGVISRLRQCSVDSADPQPDHEPVLERLLAEAVALGDSLRDFSARQTGQADTPEQLGEYRLLVQIGEGGMGIVFKGEHTKLKRLVAVKILSADRMARGNAVARFEREMAAIGKLKHPNIVHATDAREIDGIHFLVMEYIEGPTLSELVARCGPLPITDACELTRQAAEGLQYAHQHTLVHRDIKPSNLMLARMRNAEVGMRNGDAHEDSAYRTPHFALVKILDLGLALVLEEDEPPDRDLTGMGQIAGTIDYMAPEQCTDSHGVDIRADIYSLGATMHKLLVGRAPLDTAGARSPANKVAALINEDAPSLADRFPQASAELVAVVDRMMAKNPSERFSTPGEVAAALEPFCGAADLVGLLDAFDDKAGDGASSPDMTDTAEHLSQGETGTKSSAPGPAVEKRAARSERAGNRGRLFSLSAAVAGAVLMAAVLTYVFGGRNRPDQDAPQSEIPTAPQLAVVPFDADAARDYQLVWAEHLNVPMEYENSIGMKLRFVPPGEFLMGSSEQEIAALLGEADDSLHPRILAEGPQHTVRVTQPFYIGVHEVTVGQFRKFVQATGFRTYAETRARKSKFHWRKVDFEQTDEHPVVYVNWDDAVAFCQWLSTTEGHLYRLPSEAQWEFACRAGNPGRWCFGDDTEQLEQFTWLLADGPRQVVGQKQSNAFGIYDMHGNAVERCQDWYAADYYRVSPEDDPEGPATGTLRVTRGGFGLPSAPARSALRSENHAKTPLSYGGIRVVRVIR